MRYEYCMMRENNQKWKFDTHERTQNTTVENKRKLLISCVVSELPPSPIPCNHVIFYRLHNTEQKRNKKNPRMQKKAALIEY